MRPVKSDRVRANIALRVDPPEVSRHELQPWDAQEINAFLDAITGNRYAPLFTFAIATGMRQGELLGLRWSDVDESAGTLRVERQWTRQLLMAPTKSAAGHRTIGLNDLVRWALKVQTARQARDRLKAGAKWSNDENLIFTRTNGSALRHRVVWDAFATRVRVAGLRPIRFHDRRHAGATLLLTAGEDLGVISRVLGHSDLGTTLRVYAHVSPERAQAAAGRIDEALDRRLVDVDAATG